MSLYHFLNSSVVYLTNINAYYVYFCNVRMRLRSNARTLRLDMEETMGQDNLACRRLRSLTDDELEMNFMVLPQAKQQTDAGFSKPHTYPGGHYQTLDEANNLLCATGTQSEV